LIAAQIIFLRGDSLVFAGDFTKTRVQNVVFCVVNGAESW